MCDVPVKSVDVVFRNGSCVRNVGKTAEYSVFNVVNFSLMVDALSLM